MWPRKLATSIFDFCGIKMSNTTWKKQATLISKLKRSQNLRNCRKCSKETKAVFHKTFSSQARILKQKEMSVFLRALVSILRVFKKSFKQSTTIIFGSRMCIFCCRTLVKQDVFNFCLIYLSAFFTDTFAI